MKRPALYFTTLMVAIVCSTILVSTTVSSVVKYFSDDQKEEMKVDVKVGDDKSELAQVNL